MVMMTIMMMMATTTMMMMFMMLLTTSTMIMAMLMVMTVTTLMMLVKPDIRDTDCDAGGGKTMCMIMYLHSKADQCTTMIMLLQCYSN